MYEFRVSQPGLCNLFGVVESARWARRTDLGPSQAFEFLDATQSYQVYGEPSEAFVEYLKQGSGPEVPVIVKSKFTRFNLLPALAAS